MQCNDKTEQTGPLGLDAGVVSDFLGVNDPVGCSD